MQGRLTKKELVWEYPNGIPNEFDPDDLPKIILNQVVFFDEMHMNQEGGLVYKTKYQVRFPRDDQGRYSPLSPSNPNPTYAPLKNKPRYKYTQQARFCLGLAAIRTIDGRIVGKRSVVFGYLQQRLISIGEYKKKQTRWTTPQKRQLWCQMIFFLRVFLKISYLCNLTTEKRLP